MKDSRSLFWDSCVFIRYITRYPDVDLHYLDATINDVRSKLESERLKVFYSTIIYTEIRPRHIKRFGGTIDEFIASLGRNFEPIDPTPPILRWAGELRDAQPIDPSDGSNSRRVIGTPDAIQLMSAVFALEVMGVNDLVFETYDEGKSAGWEGKCVPLLNFERWFPEVTRTSRIKQVCDLSRRRPWHPHPGLNFGGARAAD